MNNKKNFVDSSFYLTEQIKSDTPFGCGKIGNCELMCLYNYFLYTHKNQPVEWLSVVEHEIYNNAGVFPQTEKARIEFIEEIVQCMPYLDALAQWSSFNSDFEDRFIRKYSPNCTQIDLQSIEPFYFGVPWTEALRDKNVLVISPFTDTIKLQYKNKLSLWTDPRILPDFNLITLEHPHSPGIDKPSKYNNWLEMINNYKNIMNTINYDILLIGAGASSLPLVAHARKNGKKGVHLGGPLQLLFGIKGNRWNNSSVGKHFYNKAWTLPSSDETPLKFKNIENGCYW
jgi:hypothetical protein